MIRRFRLLLAPVLTLALLCPQPARTAEVVKAPASAFVGQPFVVEVQAQGLSAASLSWMGRRMPLDVRRTPDAGRAVALLGSDVRDATAGPQVLELELTTPAGVRTVEKRVNLTARKYPEQRLTVAGSMAEPPADLEARLAAERQAVRAALDLATPLRRFELPLARPLPAGKEWRVTSVYGLRRFFNNQPRDPHRGLDLAAAVGTPVVAVAAGTVALAADHYFAGRCVYLDHGQGVVSAYLHLSNIAVAQGQQVAAGQVVGASGKSGRATGPHLHFGLYVLGRAVDPAAVLGGS